MDLQKSGARKWIEERSSGVVANRKISLDSYMSFIDSSSDKSDYKVGFIDQIIRTHGFRRLYHTPKKVLVEAVESINLANPSRCTLRQGISSGPFISKDEANVDIKFLEWFECSKCHVASNQSYSMDNEAPASTHWVLHQVEDVPQKSKQKSTSKVTAMHASPAKTKKRANKRKFHDMFVYYG